MMKSILNMLAGCAMVALAASGTAVAATTTFDFVNQTFINTGTTQTVGSTVSSTLGGSLTMTSGGLTVTETAWWLNTATSPVPGATTFQQASVTAWAGYGLAVCNPNEPTCASNVEHQIDNFTQVDFILLSFNTAVNLSSVVNDLTLLHYADVNGGTTNNIGMTYWTNVALTTATTFTALQTASGAGTTIGGSSGTNCTAFVNGGCTIVDDLSTTGNITNILIAAQTSTGSGNNDAFKISSLTVATPEPATFGLFGSALLFGALLARKRLAATTK